MKLTPSNWKEVRRLQAWRLKQRGWPQRQIAEALGVSAAAVSQWMKRARQGGPHALRHRPSPGAPRRLSAEQLAQLPALLRRGPAAYGFRGQLWTRKRVAEVMRLEFGVVYHPTHVGRLLEPSAGVPKSRCAGLSSATKSRSPSGATRRGRRSKRGHAQGQTIFFLDESGFYPLPSVVRTYAPMGQTPILREWCTRDHLSAISAISPEGKLYFHSQDSRHQL